MHGRQALSGGDFTRRVTAEFADAELNRLAAGLNRLVETARAISVAADAVVVGSRLVQEVEAATPETAKEQLTRLVATLKAAIR